MEKLLSLKINENEQITINIPIFGEKFNYYKMPTEKLDKFDEITVLYENNDKKIMLMQDIIDDILTGFRGDLERALNRDLILPDFICIGEIGKNYNIESHRNNETGNYKNKSMKYSDHGIFSGESIQTWIYNDHFGEIYLEISPRCPLLYREYEEGDEFVTFEDFMKKYKPYAFFHIDKKTALEWKQAVDLLYMEIDDECILH